jgi:hypothetical protein
MACDDLPVMWPPHGSACQGHAHDMNVSVVVCASCGFVSRDLALVYCPECPDRGYRVSVLGERIARDGE